MIDFKIDRMKESDWEQVRQIYLEGIVTGEATFETDVPSWEKWDAAHLPSCRLVARSGDVVKGWAALSPVSKRAVYAGVAEVSVYIGQRYRGAGVGRALLMALVDESEKNGFWTLQASIFPENSASIELHKRCGFREVGRREHIGKMGTWWRDTILLERRSKLAGVD